jgi:predicted HTH transcriptional regulator
MVFGVPLDKLSFGAIQEFCEQRVPEGSVLDYKEAITSTTLSKTACAFANTFGGAIIIGVKDEDGAPVVPAEGDLLP